MVKLKSENPEFEMIPEGTVVPVRLEDVEYNKFTWENEEVEKLKWKFVIAEQGEFYGKPIQGSTSTAFTAHPNCKAYNWASALAGRKFAEGEELDTDDLLGKPGQVIVKHRTDKNGRTWMDVRDVLPPQRDASQPAQASHDESPF